MSLILVAGPSAAQMQKSAAAGRAGSAPVGTSGLNAASSVNSLPALPAATPGLNGTLSPSVAPVLSNLELAAISQPISLTALAIPAASKGDAGKAFLRETAKSISVWKAARTVENTQRESTAAETSSLRLDELFDGSLPTSDEVLTRASSLGLDRSVLAQALSDSHSQSDAAARLASLGVLGSKEVSLSSPAEAEFRFLLTRLWKKTSDTIAPVASVDSSFSIPALTVERNGITFYIHAVAHGQGGAPRRSSVISLIRGLEREGRAVYSEQNLPAYYGFTHGRETLDHAVAADGSLKIISAAPGYDLLSLRVKRALDWAVSPGSALAALAWVIAVPTSPWAWFLLPLLTALAAYTLTGGLPLMAWKRRRLAASMRADGLTDIAEQYADEATHFFTAKPDLAVMRGLELPQPLGATDDLLSFRSRGIADAVAADAAAAGVDSAHLIVGHLHAYEVAARLRTGPTHAAPGSQIS